MKLRSGTEGVETTDDTGNYEEKSTDTLENQPLLCFECNQDLSYEPSSIRCDDESCKRLFHPSCLAKRNAGPLDNEIWFCPSCLSLCPGCSEHVSDFDEALQCDSCNTWLHCECFNISHEEYVRLSGSDERFCCGICWQTLEPNLPKFESRDDNDRISWNGLKGSNFVSIVNSIYEDITSWRRNLFKVPTGKAGQDFIEEVTKCINQFNYNTAIEPIALKLSMIAFPLLLQKPSKKSKASQHTDHLRRRIELWRTGKLCQLLREGKEIQS